MLTIWICRWRMNTLVTSQYQPRLSSITKIVSRRISQSDCSIQIKLNYLAIPFWSSCYCWWIFSVEKIFLYTVKPVTFGTKKKWSFKTGDLLKRGSIHMRFCMTGQEKSDHLIHVNVRHNFFRWKEFNIKFYVTVNIL